MIGLGPLAAGLAVASSDIQTPAAIATLQLPFSLATAVAVIMVMTLWRNYVAWNWRRRGVTSLLIGLVILHLVIFEPLWNIQCATDQLLMGQCLGVYGIWRIICPFVWWGAFVLLRKQRHKRIGGKRPMTRTAIRLLLGLSLIPILPSVFMIAYFGLDRSYGYRDDWSTSISLAICAVLAIGLWVVIWRTEVRWTTNRILGTVVLAILLCATTSVPFFSLGGTMQVVVGSAPAWMWGLWIIGTAWLWRDRPGAYVSQVPGNAGESDVEPQCPSCAYSLRGLAEARCPECGWTGTLDAVLDASLGLGDV